MLKPKGVVVWSSKATARNDADYAERVRASDEILCGRFVRAAVSYSSPCVPPQLPSDAAPTLELNNCSRNLKTVGDLSRQASVELPSLGPL